MTGGPLFPSSFPGDSPAVLAARRESAQRARWLRLTQIMSPAEADAIVNRDTTEPVTDTAVNAALAKLDLERAYPEATLTGKAARAQLAADAVLELRRQQGELIDEAIGEDSITTEGALAWLRDHPAENMP